MENVIEVKHLNKSFGTHEVLKDIDFSVSKGEVVCIIGSSGSGKSTLLRCINLLETPSGGEIIYKGENILDAKHDIYKYRTKLGMVFQQFNLFNNHDVLSNCTVGQIKVLKRSKKEAEEPENIFIFSWYSSFFFSYVCVINYSVDHSSFSPKSGTFFQRTVITDFILLLTSL